PLEGFFKGLGVVKGEGVATAKKASPFPLKKKEKNFCDKSFLNSFFKGQGKLKFESQNSFPYPIFYLLLTHEQVRAKVANTKVPTA
uniref:hypothetical protein n=1 Tax=Campylobacter porcelli TaxID=1660073 RepID=UPI001F1F8080